MTLKILRFVDRMKIFRIIKFVYLFYFQDIPSYPGSRLGLIVQHLEPLIYNDTLKEFNENVPALLALVNSSSQALSGTSMQRVINNDTLIKQIYSNVSKAEEILTRGPFFSSDNVTALLDARLK